MRTRLLVCALCLLAFVPSFPVSTDAAGPAVNVVSSSTRAITLDFQLPFLEDEELRKDGNVLHALAIPGGAKIGATGEPEIPVFARLIAVPDGTDPVVEAVLIEEESRPNILISPAAPDSGTDQQGRDVDRGHESPKIAALRDSRAYRRDALTPELLVRRGEPAMACGVRLMPLVFQPVRYNPARGVLNIARKIRVTISFPPESGSKGTGALRARRIARARPITPSMDALLRNTVVNYDEVAGTREVRPGAWVLISPPDPEVVARLEPLIEWRLRQGFTVFHATTAETGTTKESIQAWLRQAYETWETPPEYVVLAGDATPPYQIPTWFEHLSGAEGEGDHPYTQLDGDDVLADVHLGRISFSTLPELEAIVSKIVNYEEHPYLADPSWFRRAGLVADLHYTGGYSGMLLQQWAKVGLRGLGYSEIDTVFTQSVFYPMRDALNRGGTIFSYRGIYRMSGWYNSLTYGLTNGWKLPFIVALTCDTGSFYHETSLTEGFLRANTDPRNPKGGIGAIGTATAYTHTRYNNCVQFGVLQSLLYERQFALGPALTRGKLEMYRNYQATEPNQVAIWSHWNNLMGDPALECWTGVPESLQVEHLATLPVGADALTVTVRRGGQPEPGLRVCLWDGGARQWIAWTDEQGKAELAGDALVAGGMSLTVTGHNRLPYLAQIPVVPEQIFVGYAASAVDDDLNGESQGNEDGAVNPGEAIELRLGLHNFGVETAPGVTAILSTNDPYVAITDSEEIYGDLPGGTDAWSLDDFGFTVSPACPDGHRIRFDLDVHSASDSWHSLVELPVVAPDLTAEGTQIVDGGNGMLEPGETANLTVVLRNRGALDAQGTQGVLLSTSPWVSVTDSIGSFDAITSGQSGSNTADPFAVTADPAAYRGHPASFLLVTRCNGGMADTTRFVLLLGAAASTDPTGPDGYGYSVLDNTDLTYPDRPVYEWIELDPGYGGTSGEVVLGDIALEHDHSITVDLPFNFQFYGNVFRHATICSNGWLALGSTYLSEYRNWSIPGAGAPSNLLAVFWDNLNLGQGGRVLQRYDRDAHRWTVEWSRVGNEWGQEPEVFEAILYDPAFYPTASGDGIIVYQYHTVASVDALDGYATVGIQNDDHTDGLLYTYADQYAPGAARLESGRAVRFVPALAAPRGRIEGTVRNASWFGAPVENAEIRVLRRNDDLADEGDGVPLTDASGRYMLCLPEGVYSVTARAPGFEPDSVADITVSIESPASANFGLHDAEGPEITDVTRIEHAPSPGPFRVEAEISDRSTVQSASLWYRHDGGPWRESAMDLALGMYSASIPSGSPGQEIDYYIGARDGIGQTTTSPADAPAHPYSFAVTALHYSYAVENPPDAGWLVGVPGDDAIWGQWTQMNPAASYVEGQQVSPEDDHTPGPGTNCFITGKDSPYVQYGCTTLQSPVFDLSGASEAYVRYWRWFASGAAHDAGDGFTIRVSSDGGESWALMDSLRDVNESWWQPVDRRLTEFIDLTDRVVFRFGICDRGAFGIYSGAIDDFSIETLPTDPSVSVAEVATFGLQPVRPNPQAGGNVNVTFSLDQAGWVRLAIYDVQGRLVRTLLEGTRPAGAHTVSWDGRAESGAPSGAGVFFGRLDSNGRREVSKIIRIR